MVGGAVANKEVMEREGRKLAMHIVAMKPEFLDLEDVPEAKRKEEEDVFLAQMEKEEAESGKKPKPEDIKRKIISGKMNKWAKGVALMEQEHVANGEEGGVIGKILEKNRMECRGFGLL